MSEYLNSARAENFIGRQWLYREIENILASDDISGVLIIGNPGTGKSALSSQLICSRTTSSRIHSRILGYHLCKYSDKNTQMAGKFVRNLAEMIARRLPEYGYLVSNSSLIQRSFAGDCIQNQDPGGCFEQAIIFPLRNLKNKPQENWYIVLDALDECVTQGSEKRQSIVHLLNNKIHGFPPWLKLVMTSRNESDASLHSSKIKKLIIDPEDSRNLEDIELFVTTRLYQGGPLLYRIISWFGDDSVVSTTKLVTALLSKSQGNFLFVKEVLHHWELSKHELKDAYALPKTLGDLYHSYFQRLETRKGSFNPARRILELLVAAIEPLPQKEIFDVLRMKEEDLDEEYGIRQIRNRLKELGHFLKYGENDTVTLYHLSLAEWLTSGGNEDFFVSKKKGHEIFCDYYFSLIRRGDKSTLLKYILSLAQHIAYGGWKEAYVQEFLDFPSQVVNSSDPHSNRTLLHLAATINSTDVLELLLRHFRFIDCVDNLGMTPAFLAAEHGLVDNLALLVQRGADVNRKTKSILAAYEDKPNIPYIEMPVYQTKSKFFNSTMLHVASQRGHKNVVRFLLNNNAAISTLNGAHLSAIQLAAENGHLEVVKALHKAGAVADQTALHHAAAKNRLEVVDFLLDNGVKDECLRCDGSFYWLKTYHRFQEKYSKKEGSMTPARKILIWRYSYWEIVIEDDELFDDKHLILCHSALHAAVGSGHDKIISRLLSEESNALSCQDYSGRTPIHEAIRKNNTKIVNILLEKDPKIIHYKCGEMQEGDISNMLGFDELDEYRADICHCGYTPLHLAARYGFEHLGVSFIIKGARVDEEDCNGATPFHVAACHDQVGFIYIFSHPNVHGDINRKTLNGSTPLHSAAACGAVDAIDYLHYYKANLTAVDDSGLTALHYSIIHAKTSQFAYGVFFDDSWSDGTFELTKVDHMGNIMGIFLNEKQIENTYPYQGLNTLVKLVFTGSDIDAVDINGQTPLHIAAHNGLVYVVEVLLQGNATLEKRDNNGKTPLEVAIENAPQMDNLYSHAYGKVVGYLMFHGASPGKCNRSGNSLLHRAIINQQPHIIQQLLLKGASLTCKDNLGRTPLVTYLQNGGKWIDTIINAFSVSVAIKCGEPFNTSLFHLLSYRPPTIEDDNFFDSRTCKFYNPGECKVNNGALANAIESHPSKQEIIRSCLDTEGFTPLHRAAQGGNVIAIRYLLANGADDSILSPHGHDALTLAVLFSGSNFWRLHGGYYTTHEEMLEMIRASDAAIELLHHAMKSRGYQIACDSSKPELTLYHLAASRGLANFIEVLLKEKESHQVDVNCPNKDGLTPMYLAKIFGKGMSDGGYNPWEHVIQIIKSHGGEMQYPEKDAEYNVIYNRLYGWIPNAFTLDLSPSTRHFIPSLLTMYQKSENNSFFCSLETYDDGINLISPHETFWVEILNALFLRKDNNQFLVNKTFLLRGFNLCSRKYLEQLKLKNLLATSILRGQASRFAYLGNIAMAGKWETLAKKQQNWFKRKMFLLLQMRHKETFGSFFCFKSWYFKYQSLLHSENLRFLFRQYTERPPSSYLTSICQDFEFLFERYLSYHRQRNKMPFEFTLYRTDRNKYSLRDFFNERITMPTGKSFRSTRYFVQGIDGIEWPLEFLLKRFLGLFGEKYDYLKTLNVGIDHTTLVPLYTEQMRQIWEEVH